MTARDVTDVLFFLSFGRSVRADAGVKKKRHGVKDDVPIESLGLSDEESAAKEDADARVLKTFDLTSKYGPCCGMTRLERYDRAAGLGLDPPKKVLEVIQRRGVDDPRWRECVWFTLV